MGKNLATKFSPKVDERFTIGSKISNLAGNEYDWEGVESINVYSWPVIPMGDYNPGATNVYGTPVALQRNKQEMKITQKRAFTFKLEQLDRLMDMMVTDATKQLQRQIDQVVIPEYDQYVAGVLGAAATDNGNIIKTGTALTQPNDAYKAFLAGQEYMADVGAPDNGRVCLCTHHALNLLKQADNFLLDCDIAQNIKLKGVVGMVDGTKLVPVPSSRLPIGTSFLFTHPYAFCAPEKLRDFIVHDNPVGWNGWIVEGLVCYDAFVLNNKADGIFLVADSGVAKRLNVCTSPAVAAGDTTKTLLSVLTPLADSTHSRAYYLDNAAASVAYGDTVVGGTTSGWTALTADSAEISNSDSKSTVTVVETDADDKVVGIGVARVNMA